MAEGMKSPPGIVKLLFVLCVLGGTATGFFFMRGCQDVMHKSDASGRVPAVIGSKTFMVEPALDDATRIKGLGQRDKIDPDGGMVFVFPFPAVLGFVMRDCPVPIDIAFLDDAGRVLSMYEMQPEEPRKAGESDADYDNRLKRYSSRYPSRLVIEVAGGSLRSLGLKEGDKVKLDIEGLKRRVK